jgi:hypothetical protein
MRLRLEKIGFWILVVAALGVILLLVGFLLPTLLGAASTGFFAGLFVSLLTLMNLPRAAGWGNSLLGRRVFPVIQAPDSDIIRLAGVNGVLVAIFTFIYRAIASTFVGPFFGGLIVFVALVAAAVFYNRVRSVVTKP